MQKSSFFNSIDGDRKYKAEEWAEYFASFIGNGVFPEPSTNLMIEANGDMTVTVKAGKAWINGYFYYNTTDLILTLDNADGVLKRIDRIVVRWSLTNRSIETVVKKGSFASSPVPPALQRDSDNYELALADIAVNNGVIQITQGNITDLRQNATYCGIVSGTVDQIDASGLFAQYEQAFNDWFGTIENILDENTAANLLNLINANTTALNNHKADYVAQPANGGTTGGTATAYTCTSDPAPASLTDKIGVIITAHVDSGANPTLNWNTLGAKAIKKPNGNAATLKSGGVYTLRYNATTANFILQGEGASGNAIASDLLSGKTASTDAGDIVGTMTNRGAVNITPSTADQAIPAGYHNGAGVVYGDADLVATNIKNNINIFGVTGSLSPLISPIKYITAINVSSNNASSPMNNNEIGAFYSTIDIYNLSGTKIRTFAAPLSNARGTYDPFDDVIISYSWANYNYLKRVSKVDGTVLATSPALTPSSSAYTLGIGRSRTHYYVYYYYNSNYYCRVYDLNFTLVRTISLGTTGDGNPWWSLCYEDGVIMYCGLNNRQFFVFTNSATYAATSGLPIVIGY